MYPCVFERARAIARGIERAHQAQGDSAAVQIVCRQLPPPARRGGEIAALFARLRECLEGAGVSLTESRALAIQPALELGAVGQMESIHQRTGERVDRELEPPVVE